jgi:hypothetical protein
MSENQHIYEDLNESFSARLGGSQQWKILPSPIVRGRQTFQILTRRRNFPRRGDFNVHHSSFVRLHFYEGHKFCMSVYIFRSNFQQQFSAAIFRSNFPQQFSAAIFYQNFRHPPQLS